MRCCSWSLRLFFLIIRVLVTHLRIYRHHCHIIFAIMTRVNCVLTAGEAGQAAWRAPGASAAGIVRSGPGAGRDVRGVGDRNGVCFRTWRHRRRDGTAEQAGGRLPGSSCAAPARRARVPVPGPCFPRRTGPARFLLALRAPVLPPPAAARAGGRRGVGCQGRTKTRPEWRRKIRPSGRPVACLKVAVRVG